MKILIAAGGTGGHVYPAIAIAEAFKPEGINVIFVGRKDSFEESKYKEYGFPVAVVHASQFDFGLRKVVVFVFNLVRGIREALSILNIERPDAVIGGGGYVSAPVVFASMMKRIPYFLYEQNIIPGRTNRIFKNFSRKVFLGFPDEYNFFGNKGFFTGNPLRKKITEKDKEKALAYFGFKNLPTLVVFGGSGGANRLNVVFSNVAQIILQKVGIQIVFITGEKWYDEIASKLNSNPNMVILPFLEEMGLAYSVADFAITRAGAMTMTEIAYFKVPSLVIPFPFSRDDHQKKNALFILQYGCIDLLDEKILTEDVIVDKIVYYFNHLGIIEKMKENCKGIFPENSAELIVNFVKVDING